MKTYDVHITMKRPWETEIEADSPEEAALQAMREFARTAEGKEDYATYHRFFSDDELRVMRSATERNQ